MFVVQQKKYKLNKLANLKQKCKNIIDIVGEPILYMSLMDLYAETYKESKNEFIDDQIEKLKQLKNDSNSSK